jgi:hypothetical protein
LALVAFFGAAFFAAAFFGVASVGLIWRQLRASGALA